MGIVVKMKEVVRYLGWLFSFWTWKDFVVHCVCTYLIRLASWMSPNKKPLPIDDTQQESDFARFLSSLPEDHPGLNKVSITHCDVRLVFGRSSRFFKASMETRYFEFLATVASTSLKLSGTGLKVCLIGDVSCEHVEGIVEALHRSGLMFQDLIIECSAVPASRLAKCVQSVLIENSGITTLRLMIYGFSEVGEARVVGKDEVAKLMASIASRDALRYLKSFGLVFGNLDDEGMEQLIKSFLDPPCQLENFLIDIISDLHLKYISDFLATSTSLKDLSFTAYGGVVTESGYTSIANALCSNQSLQKLSCNVTTILELKAILDPLIPKNDNLQGNTSLTTLQLDGNVGGKEGINNLVQMLRTNSSLLGLELYVVEVFSRDEHAVENVLALLEALKANKTLKEISFSNCDGVAGYKVLGCMMDLLLANHCIEDIKLGRTGLDASGDAEYVRSTLSRRKKMKLWDIVQGMATVNPSSGRVFLCGEPYAGKTTLRLCMNQLWESQRVDHTPYNFKRFGQKIRNRFKASKLSNAPKQEVSLERTRGIEVDNVVCDGIGITIWDMAGQTDYHSFHELVMPNLSADGSSSMFLLVCNPMDKSNFRPPSDITYELEYWLRLIASNTRRSLKYPPHVSIVMTHFDLWKEDKEIAACIKDVVEKLKFLFQDVLQFDEDELVFKVDGRDVSHVHRVFDFVKSHLKQLLTELPKTISACEEVRSRIAQWNVDNPKQPLLKWDEFCESMCKEVEEFDDADHELANRRKEFVAVSLNDGGHIIYNEKEKVVVTNPHWFCHDIVGQFLHRCANKGRDLEMVSSNGMISIAHMKRFILELIEGEEDIDRKFDEILGMMKKLNMCYEQDVNHIMIPSTLEDKHQSLSWSGDDESRNSMYVGRRLACKDGRRTMLTPGFFTRLQASFFWMLKVNNGQDTYQLFRDIIKFISDGIEVIIQFNDGDIDIFLRSGHSQDQMLEFLDNGIVMHVKHLQEDPTLGCLGVVLDDYIWRPACVRKLINCKDRKDQCVHFKDLEDGVIQRGELKATHNWKRCKGLDIGCDEVKTLVGSVAWKCLLERRSQYLQEYHKKVQGLSGYIQDHPSNHNEEKSVSLTPSCIETFLLPTIGKKVDQILEGQRELMITLNDIKQSIQDLEDHITKMEGSILHELRSRIDVLMAFSIEMQKSQIPKLAYLCESGRRLLTRLVPDLENLELHLVCENMYGFHEVANQEGCVVNFGTKNTRRFLVMVEWSLKIATILTKIGAHVACGAGDMIPNFSEGMNYAALIVDTFGLEGHEMPMITLESSLGGVREVPKISIDDKSEAQKWLRDFLEPLCEKKREFYEKFKLRKVRYRRSNGVIAWICDACIANQRHQIDELH